MMVYVRLSATQEGIYGFIKEKSRGDCLKRILRHSLRHKTCKQSKKRINVDEG